MNPSEIKAQFSQLNKPKKRIILLSIIIGLTLSDTVWFFNKNSSLFPIDNSPVNIEASSIRNPERERVYQEQQRDRFKKRVESVLYRYRPRNSDMDLEHLANVITTRSERYGFDPMLVLAIIKTESNFVRRARSNKGARGLMQVLPSTGYFLSKELNGHWRGTKRLYEPEFNVDLGTYYLSKMMHRFGDLTLALEAYNQGPTRIQYRLNKGRKFYRKYSRTVMTHYRHLNFDFPV